MPILCILNDHHLPQQPVRNRRRQSILRSHHHRQIHLQGGPEQDLSYKQWTPRYREKTEQKVEQDTQQTPGVTANVMPRPPATPIPVEPPAAAQPERVPDVVPHPPEPPEPPCVRDDIKKVIRLSRSVEARRKQIATEEELERQRVQLKERWGARQEIQRSVRV